MPPLIAIERVTKCFPGIVALADISLEIPAGELHAVVGENGAGKSTLMKILAGIVADYQGRLRLGGEVVRFEDTRAAEKAGVSIIHQELNLVEDLSAAANIFLGREKRNLLGLLDEKAMEKAATLFLTELECHIDPRQRVRGLRVGDQQLVEIAKALSLESAILIMDEPTSALTETEVARLFRVIQRLRVRGVTMLYITHKLDEVFRLADRITVLRDGRLVKTVTRMDTTPREITHLMVGREIEAVRFGLERSPGEVILEVKELSLPQRDHARAWRLRKIDFSLRRGEILGIAGLMGAGRTELLECLFGSSPAPVLGRILLGGKEVRFTHPAQAKEAGVAFISEDRKRLGLFSQMTVRENITLCTLPHSVRFGLIRRRLERRSARKMIRRLSVKTADTETSITALSGGNQQKAIIGRWLLTSPKLLLMDDPTRGVDVGAKAELYRLIDSLCQKGLGIIITSSELPELLILCNRILVLCEGRLTAEFHRGEATEQSIMEAAMRRGISYGQFTQPR
jgi:ABC-type sugar transport system ATPase subunit